MQYYEESDIERLRRTELSPEKKIKMILDTDTYNEIDDQFAILYALASTDRIELLGITAVLFHNKRSQSPKDGMEKSYNEILNVLNLAKIKKESIVYRGCEEPLKSKKECVESEAVDHIIKCAMQCTKEDPLFVVGIGAATNISSAIIKEPQIMERIVVVWLGGNTYEWMHNEEFNLSQDLIAGQVLFDCGVPMIQVPAFGVTGYLITCVQELEACLEGANSIGKYLVENVKAYEKEHFAWTKPIWDIGAIAVLINPKWAPQKICPAPIISESNKYSFDGTRHLIRCVYDMDRDKIFKDMFLKISNM